MVLVLGVAAASLFEAGSIGRYVCYVVAALGASWAWVMGHACFIIPALLLGVPWSAASHLFVNPIRRRGTTALYEGARVIAYADDAADRLVVVRGWRSTVHAHGVYRRRGVLRRAQRVLVDVGVPRVAVDESRLRQAVARWNACDPFVDRMRRDSRTHLTDGVPPIALDDRSRGSADRMHYALDHLADVLPDSERDDLVQLALWQQDLADEAYGKRQRSFLDRVVLE